MLGQTQRVFVMLKRHSSLAKSVGDTGLDYPVGEEGDLGPAPTAGVGKTREQILAERDLDAPVDIAGSPVLSRSKILTNSKKIWNWQTMHWNS